MHRWQWREAENLARDKKKKRVSWFEMPVDRTSRREVEKIQGDNIFVIS